MAYTYECMRKLSWDDVMRLHQSEGLQGYYKLYEDGSEGQIDQGYTWEEIEEHYSYGGEFGEEVGN